MTSGLVDTNLRLLVHWISGWSMFQALIQWSLVFISGILHTIPSGPYESCSGCGFVAAYLDVALLRLVGMWQLTWTWRSTGYVLVHSPFGYAGASAVCLLAHLSRDDALAAWLLRCSGFWHQGWNTGSHLQALSYLLLVVHGPRRCYSVHSRDGEVRHGLNQR